MTTSTLIAAKIKELYLIVDSKHSRRLELVFGDDGGSVYEDNDLNDSYGCIQDLLDDEDGLLYLDPKCEVPRSNAILEIVELAHHMYENHNPNGEAAKLLKLLGQEVVES